MKIFDYVQRYGVALLAAAVATGIWYFILRSLDANPFSILLAGVVVAALYGGLGPGAVATAACTAASFLLYGNHGVPLDVFVVLALAMTWLAYPVRAAQEELKRQIVYTRAMSDHVSEGIIMLDPRGRVTFANPAMQRIIGWSNAELRRKELFHAVEGSTYREDDSSSSTAILRALNGQEISTDSLVLKHKDGRSITVSCHAFPIFHHAEQIGTVLACRDTTEARESAKLAIGQRDQIRGLFEISPDAIVLTDAYGFILLANDRAADMYGYQSAERMMGVKIEEFFDESSRAEVAQNRLSVAQKGGDESGEYVARRSNGTRFPVELRAIALRDAHGKITGVGTFARDVSRRKETDERARMDQLRLSTQYSVSQVLLEATSADHVFWKWLQALCTGAEWDVGIYWQADEVSNYLQCVDLWNPPWVSVPRFADMTRRLQLAPGVDLPGRVWLRGDTIWSEDVTRESGFSRASAASEEGLRSAFYFPIRSESSFHGVCEILSRNARPFDSELAGSLSQLGYQLGQFIDRTQAGRATEEAVPDGRER